MLYITRKRGQSIIIDGKIEVTICEVSANNVKIGITYPENTSILRKELHDKIKAQNLAASQLSNIDSVFEEQSE